MINHQSSLGVAALLVSAVLSACAQPVGEEHSSSLGVSSQAIIGGTPAPGAEYGAVGALVYYFPEIGVLDTWCSGTLVAPQAIVTARHCTPNIDLANQSGLVPAFAFGPDAFNPIAVIPITGYVNGTLLGSGASQAGNGRIGLQTLYGSARFDDVSVTDAAPGGGTTTTTTTRPGTTTTTTSSSITTTTTTTPTTPTNTCPVSGGSNVADGWAGVNAWARTGRRVARAARP